MAPSETILEEFEDFDPATVLSCRSQSGRLLETVPPEGKMVSMEVQQQSVQTIGGLETFLVKNEVGLQPPSLRLSVTLVQAAVSVTAAADPMEPGEEAALGYSADRNSREGTIPLVLQFLTTPSGKTVSGKVNRVFSKPRAALKVQIKFFCLEQQQHVLLWKNAAGIEHEARQLLAAVARDYAQLCPKIKELMTRSSEKLKESIEITTGVEEAEYQFYKEDVLLRGVETMSIADSGHRRTEQRIQRVVDSYNCVKWGHIAINYKEILKERNKAEPLAPDPQSELIRSQTFYNPWAVSIHGTTYCHEVENLEILASEVLKIVCSGIRNTTRNEVKKKRHPTFQSFWVMDEKCIAKKEICFNYEKYGIIIAGYEISLGEQCKMMSIPKEYENIFSKYCYSEFYNYITQNHKIRMLFEVKKPEKTIITKENIKYDQAEKIYSHPVQGKRENKQVTKNDVIDRQEKSLNYSQIIRRRFKAARMLQKTVNRKLVMSVKSRPFKSHTIFRSDWCSAREPKQPTMFWGDFGALSPLAKMDQRSNPLNILKNKYVLQGIAREAVSIFSIIMKYREIEKQKLGHILYVVTYGFPRIGRTLRDNFVQSRDRLVEDFPEKSLFNHNTMECHFEDRKQLSVVKFGDINGLKPRETDNVTKNLKYKVKYHRLFRIIIEGIKEITLKRKDKKQDKPACQKSQASILRKTERLMIEKVLARRRAGRQGKFYVDERTKYIELTKTTGIVAAITAETQSLQNQNTRVSKFLRLDVKNWVTRPEEGQLSKTHCFDNKGKRNKNVSEDPFYSAITELCSGTIVDWCEGKKRFVFGRSREQVQLLTVSEFELNVIVSAYDGVTRVSAKQFGKSDRPGKTDLHNSWMNLEYSLWQVKRINGVYKPIHFADHAEKQSSIVPIRQVKNDSRTVSSTIENRGLSENRTDAHNSCVIAQNVFMQAEWLDEGCKQSKFAEWTEEHYTDTDLKQIKTNLQMTSNVIVKKASSQDLVVGQFLNTLSIAESGGKEFSDVATITVKQLYGQNKPDLSTLRTITENSLTKQSQVKWETDLPLPTKLQGKHRKQDRKYLKKVTKNQHWKQFESTPQARNDLQKIRNNVDNQGILLKEINSMHLLKTVYNSLKYTTKYGLVKTDSRNQKIQRRGKRTCRLPQQRSRDSHRTSTLHCRNSNYLVLAETNTSTIIFDKCSVTRRQRAMTRNIATLKNAKLQETHVAMTGRYQSHRKIIPTRGNTRNIFEIYVCTDIAEDLPERKMKRDNQKDVLTKHVIRKDFTTMKRCNSFQQRNFIKTTVYRRNPVDFEQSLQRQVASTATMQKWEQLNFLFPKKKSLKLKCFKVKATKITSEILNTFSTKRRNSSNESCEMKSTDYTLTLAMGKLEESESKYSIKSPRWSSSKSALNNMLQTQRNYPLQQMNTVQHTGTVQSPTSSRDSYRQRFNVEMAKLSGKKELYHGVRRMRVKKEQKYSFKYLLKNSKKKIYTISEILSHWSSERVNEASNTSTTMVLTPSYLGVHQPRRGCVMVPAHQALEDTQRITWVAAAWEVTRHHVVVPIQRRWRSRGPDGSRQQFLVTPVADFCHKVSWIRNPGLQQGEEIYENYSPQVLISDVQDKEEYVKLTGITSSVRHWRLRHVARRHNRQLRIITRSWDSPRRAASRIFPFSGSPMVLITESLLNCGHFRKVCLPPQHTLHLIISDILFNTISHEGSRNSNEFLNIKCVFLWINLMNQHFRSPRVGYAHPQRNVKNKNMKKISANVAVTMLGSMTFHLRGKDGFAKSNYACDVTDYSRIKSTIGDETEIRSLEERSSQGTSSRGSSVRSWKLEISSISTKMIIDQQWTQRQTSLRRNFSSISTKGKDTEGKRIIYSRIVPEKHEMYKGGTLAVIENVNNVSSSTRRRRVNKMPTQRIPEAG